MATAAPQEPVYLHRGFKGNIFVNVVFYLSPSLQPDMADTLLEIFTMNGAIQTENDNLLKSTHVISESHTLERYAIDASASDRRPHIVTPAWVWTSLWSGKAPDPKFYSTDPRMIFSGVVGCSTNVPDSDREAIIAGIQALGGQWRYGLTKDVTHLFTLTDEGVKYDSAIHHYKLIGQPQVVAPQWFDDSFTAQRLLPTREYLFPEPKILGPLYSQHSSQTSANGNGELVLDQLKKALRGEVAVRAIADRQDVEAVWRSVVNSMGAQARHADDVDLKRRPHEIPEAYAEGILRGQSVYVSDSVGISEDRISLLDKQVRNAGGVLRNADADFELESMDYDIMIVEFSETEDYQEAREQGKVVATVAWLFYVLATGKVSAPEDHLLHSPTSSAPVQGLAGRVISISGYSSDARVYLKLLMARMGVTVVSSMTRNQTNILVSSSAEGEKYKRAAEWGIPVVNHIWIEECFQRWAYVEPSSQAPRFTSYPSGIDYAILLGRRGIGNVRAPVMQPAGTSSVQAPPPFIPQTSPRSSPTPLPPAQNALRSPLRALNLEDVPSPSRETYNREGTPTKVSRKRPAEDSPARSPASTRPVKKAQNQRILPLSDSNSDSDDAYLSPAELLRQAAAAKRKQPSAPSPSPIPVDEPAPRAKKGSSTNAKLSKKSSTRAKLTPPIDLESEDDDEDVAVFAPRPEPSRSPREKRQPQPRPIFKKKARLDASSEPARSSPPTEEMVPVDTTPQAGRSRRAAAMKADSGLAALAQDMNAYSKFKGDFRKASLGMGVEYDEELKRLNKASNQKRRHISVSDSESGASDVEEESQGGSQLRSSMNGDSSGSHRIRVLLTKAHIDDSIIQKFKRLPNVTVVTKPESCTHVVSVEISRTQKFLQAMNHGPTLLKSQWIIDSVKASSVLPEDNFILNDPIYEKERNFVLTDAIRRGRQHAKGHRLFEGCTFLVTKNVQPELENLRVLLSSAGAKVAKRLKVTQREAVLSNHYIISTEADRPAWEYITIENPKVKIYTMELVLNSMQAQMIDWDQKMGANRLH